MLFRLSDILDKKKKKKDPIMLWSAGMGRGVYTELGISEWTQLT